MEIMTDFGAAPLLVDSITLIDHPMVVNVDTPSREDSTNSDDNDLAVDHNPMYSIPIDFNTHSMLHYITPFLRILGMKIGLRCEISTAVGMIPSLVEIGDDSFVGDSVMLGDPVIHRDQMHLKKKHVSASVSS